MISFLCCSAEGIAIANGATTVAMLELLVERKIITRDDARKILSNSIACLEPRINVPPRWRLFGTVSYLDLDVQPAELQLATNIAGSTAQVQASLRSNLDLGNDWELGIGLRYVEDLPALNVDSYVGAEVRVAKELTEGVKLALVGQNLWEPRHAEFRSASFPIDPYIERSVYLALTWRR